MSSQFTLLKTRRFGPFFGTQFLGAFNDNLFKNALIVLLTFQASQWTTLKPELLANLAAGVFILPPADTLRHGPSHLPLAHPVVRFQIGPGHSHCPRQGESGIDGAGSLAGKVP
jgi:hypothetical protein